MDEFLPIIMLLIFWVVIGLPVAAAKKAAEQKKKTVRLSARPAPEETAPSQPQQPSEPERLTTLSPSISPSGHDDSVYLGSMNAFTGEGYDPCHEEQMLPLTAAEESGPAPAPAPAHPGLPLGWTGNDIVRGIVMSEILNRKH